MLCQSVWIFVIIPIYYFFASQQGTASDAHINFDDDWPFGFHDAHLDVHPYARSIRRLLVHGHVPVGRHAILRPPAHPLHAGKISAGFRVPP